MAAQMSRVTLVRLIPNGSTVKKGDALVEFDLTTLLDEERDTVAKIADLSHQIDERVAKASSDSTKRSSQIKEASS